MAGIPAVALSGCGGFYQRGRRPALLVDFSVMRGVLRRHWVAMLIAAAALAADQASKLWVVQTLAYGESIPRYGFFRFTHVTNTGSAFGLLGGQNLVLTVASFAGIGALLYFYRSHDQPTLWARGSLGLMLAGAVGNLIDRIRLGHVTDFIDIGPWYIFNLADASIVVGVIILGATMLFGAARGAEPAALVTVSVPGDEEGYE